MPDHIERQPAEEFRGLIKKFWLLPQRGGRGPWFLDAPPDGNFDLVFILSKSRSKILYVGPFTELRRIPLMSSCDYFCVWFRPGIMPRLADVDASDLVNKWADLPMVLGTRADELGERLSALQGIDARQRLIEDFFRKTGLASAAPEALYRRAASLVESSGGRIRVAGLASKLAVTPRTLERMFREQAGLSPKKFIRLVRFQNILTELRSGAPFINLADLASEWGYADQSHFIRDFKSLMGTSPGAL